MGVGTGRDGKKEMRKLAMIKCPECGKMYSDTAASCPNCGYRKRRDFSQATMLITGTMSIVLAALCLNQSITVFRLTNIAGMQDYGGIAGILMAVFFIFASILAICLRKIDSTWPPLVCMGIWVYAYLPRMLELCLRLRTKMYIFGQHSFFSVHLYTWELQYTLKNDNNRKRPLLPTESVPDDLHYPEQEKCIIIRAKKIIPFSSRAA